MSKKQNNLFIIILFSIFCIVKPVSYEEMVSRHRIYSQETELVHKKCSNLKDLVLSGPEELELLEKSNEIILPKIINADIESIEEVKGISYKKDENFELKTKAKTKTKTQFGTNSIFVEGWSQIRRFPTRPRLNYYDSVEQRIVRPKLMFKAHLTCNKEQDKLPRKITRQDKTVKFNKKFCDLFKKNYEVFGYNLYLEENLSKTASNKEVRKAKDNLWKKYGSASREYLRENLFRNPCIIKSEECKYLDTSDYVTIYYDHLTDLFAIVNQKSNCLLDFGIATEVKYAEIFAYKSSGSLKAKDICLSPNEKLEENPQIEELLQINPSREFPKSKQLEVYQEEYILSRDEGIAILQTSYGPIADLNFITVAKGEFKIEDEQAAIKIEHAVCFEINPADYNFSQAQAIKINAKGGILAYLRKGNKLPSLDLVRAYQNAIKNFCEDRNRSDRDDKSTFQGEPSITFINKETRQVAIFDRETKIFITAYKINEAQYEEYETTGNIGNIGKTNKN